MVIRRIGMMAFTLVFLLPAKSTDGAEPREAVERSGFVFSVNPGFAYDIGHYNKLGGLAGLRFGMALSKYVAIFYGGLGWLTEQAGDLHLFDSHELELAIFLVPSSDSAYLTLGGGFGHRLTLGSEGHRNENATGASASFGMGYEYWLTETCAFQGESHGQYYRLAGGNYLNAGLLFGVGWYF